MSKGRAGNNDFVASDSPAAILVRHHAASSNCNFEEHEWEQVHPERDEAMKEFNIWKKKINVPK